MRLIYLFTAFIIFQFSQFVLSAAQNTPKEVTFKGNIKLVLKEGYFISGDEATISDINKEHASTITGHAFLCDGVNLFSADTVEFKKNSQFSVSGNVKIKLNDSYLTADHAHGKLKPKINVVLGSKSKNGALLMMPKAEITPQNTVSLGMLEKVCMSLYKKLAQISPTNFIRKGFSASNRSNAISRIVLKSDKIMYNEGGVIAAQGKAQWVQFKDNKQPANTDNFFQRLIEKDIRYNDSPDNMFVYDAFAGNVAYALHADRLDYNPKTRILRATDTVKLYRDGNLISTDAIQLVITDTDYTIKSADSGRVKMNITPLPDKAQ